MRCMPSMAYTMPPEATFGRDYYFDGAGEFVNTRGTSNNLGTFNPSGIGGSFDFHWNNCYRTINRANYVLENISKIQPNLKTQTEKDLVTRLTGEARFFACPFLLPVN